MYKTIPQMLLDISEKFPESIAQYSKDSDGNFQPTSYKVLFEEVQILAAGLIELGIKRKAHVGLISENRKEWLLADLAVLSLGAADVPRGCDSMPEEIEYILSFSECEFVFVENQTQLDKVLGLKLPALKTIIVLDSTFKSSKKTKNIIAFNDVMKSGEKKLKSKKDLVLAEIQKSDVEDLATMIFTSGTTGTPKGVMLCHRNFVHQVMHVPELLELKSSDKWLCVLPVWHSFERIMQYVSIGAASALAYSKPIGKIMLADFAKINPTWMASVPRIWEAIKAGIYKKVNSEGGAKKVLFNFFVTVGSLHSSFEYQLKGLLPEFKKRNKILDIAISIVPYILLSPFKLLGDILVFKKVKAKLGKNFVAGISGGGALPASVDKFFSAVGILLLEGYGLTETAPVLGVRAQKHPVPGTVGPVFPGTEIKICDDNNNVLEPGEKGLVYARGPQVMLGYYKNKKATKEVLDDDGWLNTGDLGMLTWNNELKITGREKDTIVLLGGENIEPVPIEQQLKDSELVDIAVVLGQDKKFIATLIVPDFQLLEEIADEKAISYKDVKHLVNEPEILKIYSDLINEKISIKNGFKSFERIFRFKLLPESFSLGKELSGKQDLKRHEINKIYKREIDELFK